MSPDQNHDEGEDEGEDWRSVSTRRPDTGSLSRARSRAREPGRGRTADDPAQIPALGWKDVLWRILYSFPRDRIFTTAGGVAFFTLLSTFPALATIVSVYSLFSDPHVISEHLSLLSGVLPSGVLALLSDQLIRVAQQSAGALSTASLVSVLIAFWSANSGVSALFDALNVIYREREKRSLVRFYATTFLFTLSGIVFALTATGLVVILPLALDQLGLGVLTDVTLRLVRWPGLLILVSIGLAVTYRYGPSRREAKWRWVSWGGVAAAITWVCASVSFSWYVASFDSYNRIYGSLGAGVGFMTWIWFSVVIVLLGAKLNAEIERQTARDSTRGQPKPLGSREAHAADTIGPTEG
ncbi:MULTISPECIES: YihY/virulence factor BrkB family protein [unclassified Methylobacterium]|uniref:YihY/virulence factor BrkB family protein n=1 Tax=unclassified Methylobacterium TaxID=2615210 RepID=UPI0005BAF6A1|nr:MULTISPECIES: YihY/virulence factor BrkB family protein [unclassified Methylobacterium]WFS06373.1 YihY/virulence factor BrkB family protein [Methylobacterium sp. 391_Methyba4]SFV04999.1 membrane protein [Methylobacterium sp. UNCCL125]